MDIKISIPAQSIEKFRRDLENKLQVAAAKGWERAVELTPAAGETPYSTGQLRQSLRFQKTGDLEYTFFAPPKHAVFVEFGTGPKGQATGGMEEFPNDPQPGLSYHNGEVLVTRSRGMLLKEPYIRHTQGQEAQPFMRPALLEAIRVFKELMNK